MPIKMKVNNIMDQIKNGLIWFFLNTEAKRSFASLAIKQKSDVKKNIIKTKKKR